MGHPRACDRTHARAPAPPERGRGFEDFGWTDNWITFSFADSHDAQRVNSGPLQVMVENHIQPHLGFPAQPHRDVEIVTYGASGTLTPQPRWPQ